LSDKSIIDIFIEYHNNKTILNAIGEVSIPLFRLFFNNNHKRFFI